MTSKSVLNSGLYLSTDFVQYIIKLFSSSAPGVSNLFYGGPNSKYALASRANIF